MNNKTNWVNTYPFKLTFEITDKSNITPFMCKHKMFPGNNIVCYTNVQPCRTLSLSIEVVVMHNCTIVDRFKTTQGMFCKIMSNIYNPDISSFLS